MTEAVATRAGWPTIGIVLQDFALGGTERIAARMATQWATEGARVTIFCGSAAGEMRSLLGANVTVVEASPRIARAPGSRRKLGQAAARHFARERVEVAFLPGNFHWPAAPAIAAMPRGRRPAIVAQVSAALAKPQRPRLRQIAFALRMRWLLRGARAVVALSDPATRQAEHILGGGRAVTIPLPALPDDSPHPRPVDQEARIVLAAGRLVPEKGFDLLIEAIAGLPDAMLVVLGEGPDRLRLEQLAERLAVSDRVSLPGYVTGTRDWLDRARLFVLPSRFEGFPAVLVEALAAGRPVVATACTPAIALIDDPAVGRVVPIDDAAALRVAIAAMLASPPPDPAFLAAKVERHRMGAVARAYLALFDKLVAGR